MSHFAAAFADYCNECNFFGYEFSYSIFLSLWIENAYDHLRT